MATTEGVSLPITQTEVLSAPSTSVYSDDGYYTIENYLDGLVRNITIDDAAMRSILARADVMPRSLFYELSEREKKLCEAYLYLWLSTSPVSSSRIKDADGQWSHEEGGEQLSATVLAQYLKMANQLFSELGVSTVGSNKWGFVGRGFHDIHRSGRYTRNLRS